MRMNDTDYEKRFSDRLRFLRNRQGISAREMSIALGQNVNYVNLIENGKRTPSLRGFFALCDYLETTPEIFFAGESGTDHDSTADDAPVELSAALSHLTDAQARAVLHLIQAFREPQ